jgi:hypothetical protein
MPEPSGYQHQRRVFVGGGADHSSASSNLAHQALQWVVGSQTAPVLGGKAVVAQRLVNAVFNDLSRLGLLLFRGSWLWGAALTVISG